MDINDLTIVLAHYGQTGMTWTQGEFTGDGTVDINDLTIVLAHYNQSAAAGSPARWPPCPSRARWRCWRRLWPACWPAPPEALRRLSRPDCQLSPSQTSGDEKMIRLVSVKGPFALAFGLAMAAAGVAWRVPRGTTSRNLTVSAVLLRP